MGNPSRWNRIVGVILRLSGYWTSGRTSYHNGGWLYSSRLGNIFGNLLHSDMLPFSCINILPTHVNHKNFKKGER